MSGFESFVNLNIAPSICLRELSAVLNDSPDDQCKGNQNVEEKDADAHEHAFLKKIPLTLNESSGVMKWVQSAPSIVHGGVVEPINERRNHGS